jgi:phytoene synthase
MTADIGHCRRVLREQSKSFALAARLFPPPRRDHIAAVYAWCRRCDDAIDCTPPADRPRMLQELRRELRALYDGAAPGAPEIACFRAVVRQCRIPFAYPAALLDGMAMDVEGRQYETLTDLRRYAFRVAGTVGLMFCRIVGVDRLRALVPAAHLGVAMQLTNICRDVREDWERGRLYVPRTLVPPEVGVALWAHLGGPLPAAAVPALSRAVQALLAAADRHYRTADRGLVYLDPRSRVGVRAARLIYAAIGQQIARRGHDVLAPRAVVPRRRKLGLALRAAVHLGLGLALLGAGSAGAQPLSPGTYRLETRTAARARIPVLGESRSATVSVALARVRAADGGLVQSHRVCAARIDGGGLVRMVFPARFIAALAEHSYPLELRPASGGWLYRADLGTEHVGYVPSGDRALPRTADDPSVVDWDDDGRPGATLGLAVPIAPDGELHIVQRGRTVLEGRVSGPDRVEGRALVPLFEQAVIGARPDFLRRSPEIVPDPDGSRFVLERVGDDDDCTDLVRDGAS